MNNIRHPNFKKAQAKKTSRKEHQKKPIRKGLKSRRGQPEHYSEIKKCVSIGITPTALAGLDELSQERGISRSEMIERIGRGSIKLVDIDTSS
ncbi:MAG: ribbon-helix-helix protein, CopG family [Tolypothrix sp. T3-bin4]|nr:ribbon-helix-helix protein, CopG family [Tolypothrix sp. Co-bin9]MBD0302296.1 ribbon-helix-helix protein, CopG family [Tolypothrix sp. T3-bin4]